MVSCIYYFEVNFSTQKFRFFKVALIVCLCGTLCEWLCYLFFLESLDRSALHTYVPFHERVSAKALVFGVEVVVEPDHVAVDTIGGVVPRHVHVRAGGLHLIAAGSHLKRTTMMKKLKLGCTVMFLFKLFGIIWSFFLKKCVFNVRSNLCRLKILMRKQIIKFKTRIKLFNKPPTQLKQPSWRSQNELDLRGIEQYMHACQLNLFGVAVFSISQICNSTHSSTGLFASL